MHEIIQTLWNKYKKEKESINPNLLALNMQYSSFQMTQEFLIEIWDRILKDLKLDNDYWSIQAEIHYSEVEEVFKPSEDQIKTLQEYAQHRFSINLDVEDWFLHSHILMEKYAKLIRLIMILTSRNERSKKLANGLPNKSFNEHVKHVHAFITKQVFDEKYSVIIEANKTWYYNDVKDIRDDLIEHEEIGRFWGSSVTQTNFTISRFRHTGKMKKELYTLRDKYADKFYVLKGNENIFDLMDFFETNIAKLEEPDSENVKRIRRQYGREFPDIPLLFSKMNTFFSSVNDYLMIKEKENETENKRTAADLH